MVCIIGQVALTREFAVQHNWTGKCIGKTQVESIQYVARLCSFSEEVVVFLYFVHIYIVKLSVVKYVEH